MGCNTITPPDGLMIIITFSVQLSASESEILLLTQTERQVNRYRVLDRTIAYPYHSDLNPFVSLAS